MQTTNILYKHECPINNHIKIIIPTVGEIIEDEDNYYSIITVLTAMPIDLMVPLDDAGIDFTQINEYDLFLIMFGGLATQDTSLVFGDLDLSQFKLDINPQNGNFILKDTKNGIIIDSEIHAKIANTLRKIHHLEKNKKKPANKEAKEYMLERARIKAMRNKNHPKESQLEPLIVAMVNTEQYKYNFETTRNISIYQFNESVRQIIHKVDYDNTMYGIYSGTVSAKDMKQEDLNWLIHK